MPRRKDIQSILILGAGPIVIGQWTRVFDTTLRTSEPAVTGLLYECWLT